jgi:hypothetical protein
MTVRPRAAAVHATSYGVFASRCIRSKRAPFNYTARTRDMRTRVPFDGTIHSRATPTIAVLRSITDAATPGIEVKKCIRMELTIIEIKRCRAELGADASTEKRAGGHPTKD